MHIVKSFLRKATATQNARYLSCRSVYTMRIQQKKTKQSELISIFCSHCNDVNGAYVYDVRVCWNVLNIADSYAIVG